MTLRQASQPKIGPALLVATGGADDADGVNAVVPVGPEALLFR